MNDDLIKLVWVLVLWATAWGFIGAAGSMKFDKPGTGFIIGMLLGPFVLFVYLIPTASDLKLQLKGKSNE